MMEELFRLPVNLWLCEAWISRVLSLSIIKRLREVERFTIIIGGLLLEILLCI